MRLASAVCLLALLALPLAGCLEDDAPPAAADEPADDASDGASVVTRTGTTDLGSAQGSTVVPIRMDFEVVVPPGGATDVRWELTIDLLPADSTTAHVEGEGCDASGASIVLRVGASSTISSSCADLDEGTYTFTAVLDQPAPSFVARVVGEATVVYNVP